MRRLLLELGVLATLLVSFLTISLPLPHVLTATAWASLTCLHVARRRRIYYAELCRAENWWRLVGSTALIGCAGVVMLSGIAALAGIAAATPWHAGSSSLLVVLAATHAARRRWLWRAQRRRRGNSPPEELPNRDLTGRQSFCAAPSE